MKSFHQPGSGRNEPSHPAAYGQLPTQAHTCFCLHCLQTARDKTVDCALAELHLRTKQLHDSVSQSKDSVMFQAVYGR